MTSAQFETLKTKIIPVAKENGIVYVALFGSLARGKATKKSDVDLLVRFSKPVGLFKFVGIEKKLSHRLKKKVDLVTEASVSPYILPHISKDLKVLYEE
jgi:predicted nucleotidyltransferase